MSTVVSADLEEELPKYETVVANIRAQRNSYLPALRIPPEILGHIFTLRARQHYESYKDGPPFGIVPDWIHATRVCRYWRGVALNCSTPWKYHFVVSHAWTDALLARSGRASLMIHFCWSPARTDAWWSTLVEKLLGHTDRIQELHLRVGKIPFPSTISFHAPRLQVLDIEGGRGPSPGTSPKVYEWDTPLLHTLILDHCPFRWWQSLSLRRVTMFRLCDVLFRVNIMNLLPALGQMKALEGLHIENALENAFNLLSSGTLYTCPKIGLPSGLTRLFVAATVTAVAAFLFRVKIPSKTIVRLEIREGAFFVDEFFQLPVALEQAFSQSMIRSLVIDFSFLLTLYASEHDICDVDLSTVGIPPLDRRIPLVIRIDRPAWEVIYTSEPTISNICCAFSSNHRIPTIHMIKPLFISSFWMVISSRFCGLRHIKLSNGFMPDMASLLAIPADEPLGRGDDLGPMYFPTLEKLTLYKISFSTSSPNWIDVISFKSLQDALERRKGPQIELAMIDCNTDVSFI